MDQIQHNLIKIEGDIEINTVLNTRNIQIAISNIDDLNQRWDNIYEVIYIADKQKFEPSDYTDPKNYNVVELLNRYINWNLSEGKDREYKIQTYLRSIQNKFEELNTNLHYRQLTNGLNDEDRQKVKAFINNYNFFIPSGFLSEMEKQQMESKLNKYCKELEKKYLSVAEVELILENHDALQETKLDNSPDKSSTQTRDSINQIISKYFKIKTNENSLWTRLIGQ